MYNLVLLEKSTVAKDVQIPSLPKNSDQVRKQQTFSIFYKDNPKIYLDMSLQVTKKVR